MAGVDGTTTTLRDVQDTHWLYEQYSNEEYLRRVVKQLDILLVGMRLSLSRTPQSPQYTTAPSS